MAFMGTVLWGLTPTLTSANPHQYRLCDEILPGTDPGFQQSSLMVGDSGSTLILAVQLPHRRCYERGAKAPRSVLFLLDQKDIDGFYNHSDLVAFLEL